MDQNGKQPFLLSSAVARRIEGDWVVGKQRGTRLPPEMDLVQQYKVSRKTIRAALAKLEKRNIIVKKTGGGTYVGNRLQALYAYEWGQVGLVLPHGWKGTPFYLAVLGGLSEELSQLGMTVSIATRDWRWGDGPAEIVRTYQQATGLLVVEQQPPEALNVLCGMGKPLVAVDFDATDRGIDSVCFDNRHAGTLPARRLYKLGHRRLITVFESPDKPRGLRDYAWYERREGFLAEWQKLDAPPPNIIFLEDRGKFEEIGKRVTALLRLPPAKRPTAILLPGDNFLNRTWDLCRARGLKVPRDVTIVGFRTLFNESAQGGRRMTAVCFDGYKLGATGAEHLLRLLGEGKTFRRKGVMRVIKGRYVAGKTHARACR